MVNGKKIDPYEMLYDAIDDLTSGVFKETRDNDYLYYIDKYGEDPTLEYAISLGADAALELIKEAKGKRIVAKEIGIGGFEFTFE